MVERELWICFSCYGVVFVLGLSSSLALQIVVLTVLLYDMYVYNKHENQSYCASHGVSAVIHLYKSTGRCYAMQYL